MQEKQCHVLLIDAGNSTVKFQCHRLSIPTGATGKWAGDCLISKALTSSVVRIDNADVNSERLLQEWGAAFNALSTPDRLGSFNSDHHSGRDRLIRWHLCWVSVGPVSIQKSIQDAFAQLSGGHAPPAIVSAPELRLVRAGGRHLKNCYERPSQLGADRWAAAVGWVSACSIGTQGPPIHGMQMIVSAGTATTIDLVRADVVDGGTAEFLGGWILPGVGLMNTSLRAGTRDLNFSVDQATGIADIPNQSQQAITGGIGLAQAGFLGRLMDCYPIEKIWVHGGFGPWWCAAAQLLDRSGSLQHKIVAAPQITFAGLMTLALQDLPEVLMN